MGDRHVNHTRSRYRFHILSDLANLWFRMIDSIIQFSIEIFEFVVLIVLHNVALLVLKCIPKLLASLSKVLYQPNYGAIKTWTFRHTRKILQIQKDLCSQCLYRRKFWMFFDFEKRLTVEVA